MSSIRASVGRLIKLTAPNSLKKNKACIKLFDFVFSQKSAVKSGVGRAAYFSASTRVFENILQNKPDILLLSFDDLRASEIAELLDSFKHNNAKVVSYSLDELCEQTIQEKEIFEHPIMFRFFLLQLREYFSPYGIQIIVLVRPKKNRFNIFLKNLCPLLSIHLVELVNVLESKDIDIKSSDEKNIFSLYQHQFYYDEWGICCENGLTNIEKEIMLRNLHFISGIKINRQTYIVSHGFLGAKFYGEWNSFLEKIIADAKKTESTLLVIENSHKNEISSHVNNQLLANANCTALPGLAFDPTLRKKIAHCGRFIWYGNWLKNQVGNEPVSLQSALELCQIKFAASKQKFCICTQHNRDTVADLLLSKITSRPIEEDDFGMRYSSCLVSGGVPGGLALAQSLDNHEVLEGVQKYLLPAFGSQERFDGRSVLSSYKKLAHASAFMQWGTKQSKTRIRLQTNCKNASNQFFFVEDGFIRSIAPGFGGAPGLSFFIDDLHPYYNARDWSRLEHMLASDWQISDEQRSVSRAAIDLIRTHGISKYNHAPDKTPSWASIPRYKILLLDQRVGDQSVEAGLSNEQFFRQMVMDALAHPENPLVILKRHPDGTMGGFGSYFSKTVLGPLLEHDSILFHDGEINPYALFDAVDEVGAVTSGMGFEAIIAGKPVTVYGAPFYCGWGLTNDKLRLSWRNKRRSLEELFYWAYIAHTVYYNPVSGQKTDLPGLCQYIAQEREQLQNKLKQQ